jgi:hypothetical protein
MTENRTRPLAALLGIWALSACTVYPSPYGRVFVSPARYTYVTPAYVPPLAPVYSPPASPSQQSSGRMDSDSTQGRVGQVVVAFKCIIVAHPFRGTPEYDRVLGACQRKEQANYNAARTNGLEQYKKSVRGAYDISD